MHKFLHPNVLISKWTIIARKYEYKPDINRKQLQELIDEGKEETPRTKLVGGKEHPSKK